MMDTWSQIQQTPQVQPNSDNLFIIIALKLLNTLDNFHHACLQSYWNVEGTLLILSICLLHGGEINIYFPTGVKLIAFVNQDRRQPITCGRQQ